MNASLGEEFSMGPNALNTIKQSTRKKDSMPSLLYKHMQVAHELIKGPPKTASFVFSHSFVFARVAKTMGSLEIRTYHARIRARPTTVKR